MGLEGGSSVSCRGAGLESLILEPVLCRPGGAPFSAPPSHSRLLAANGPCTLYLCPQGLPRVPGHVQLLHPPQILGLQHGRKGEADRNLQGADWVGGWLLCLLGWGLHDGLCCSKCSFTEIALARRVKGWLSGSSVGRYLQEELTPEFPSEFNTTLLTLPGK